MRIKALVIRIIRQFIHDKRSLALLFVAPLLILLMMSLVFNGQDYKPTLAAVNLPAPLVQSLHVSGAVIHSFTAEKAEEALESDEIDAIISMNGLSPSVKLEGSDPSVNKSVILLLQQIFQDISPVKEAFSANISYLHGSPSMAAFDNFGPILIGYFAFFFVFLLAGIAFLRERTGGTLERLLATPLRRSEIVIGYVIGFGIFAIIQAGLIAWFSISILDIMLVGSFWYVLLVTLLLALTALTLGTFLSAFASNEFQMMQFIPVVIVPQIFFSGLFNIDAMADWLQWMGVVMPVTYGADALRDVMIRGEGWIGISTDVYALLAFSVCFMTANVLALRKHRKI